MKGVRIPDVMASRRLPTRVFTPGFGAGMRKAPVANTRAGSLICADSMGSDSIEITSF
jgi:hypothetical protein